MSDPGGRNAWLTPENLPSGTRTITVPVPDDLEWVAIFKGALALLVNENNFEQFGSLSPVDVAERFLEMFLEIGEDMIPVGTVLQFAGLVLPDKYLWCDGSLIAITNEPELFQTIGYVYGDSLPEVDGHFYLPDMGGRVAAGVKANEPDFDEIGVFGGEKRHTLITSEMPSHNHGAFNYVGSGGTHNWAISGGGNNGAALVSNLTGGGGSHNNLQPYLVQGFMIRARK